MEARVSVVGDSASYTTETPYTIDEKRSSDGSVQVTELIQGLVAVEDDLSALQAIKTSPQGVWWSLFISMGGIFTGYISQTILSLFALPAFVDKYGTVTADGTKTITAKWQMALSLYVAGCIPGALIVGWFCDRFGRRLTAWLYAFMSTAVVFIIVFADSASVLAVGEILSGIPIGGFYMLAPLYIAEVSPMGLRGALLSSISIACQFGQLIAQGVTTAVATREDEWAYRIPFILSWVFCVPYLFGIYFMPESPWYLIHRGDRAGARKSLQRLFSSKHCSPGEIDSQLSRIEKTVLLERKLQASSSWIDLFKGTERLRTEIAVISYASIAYIGIQFAYFCNYFFTLAGLSTTQAFNLGVGNMALGIIGTFLCFVCLSYVGRRTMFLAGLVVLNTIMLIIGVLDLPSSYSTNPKFSWSQSILLVVWNFTCSLTISPVSVVFTSEIPSTRGKNRTIAVATCLSFLSMTVVGIALPYMFNPDSGNMRGKAGFVFAGSTFALLVWTYFRVPEISGRTYAEIDYLFEHKISARRFKNWNVGDLDRLVGGV